MSLSYCVLSSGSAGNCLWVRGGGVEILVDCGLSARRTSTRLRDVGLEIDAVSAAICTHRHHDHVKGAAVLARRCGLDIMGTTETISSLIGDPPPQRLFSFLRGERFRVGKLFVESVPTLHDSPGSCAFVIDDGEHRLGVLTDLGLANESLVRSFQELDGLVLEMNHDEEMLRTGPYPAFLKRRIEGRLGHLSNRQGSDLLSRLAHPGLQHVTLAHLSEENNHHEVAMEAAWGALSAVGVGPRLTVASAHYSLAPVSLERMGQLSLGPW